MPKVSVIIPLYNKERAIECTINSVLKQTYADFELIVVDDGSNDNSANIVTGIALKDKRITYIYKKNGGVSSARNFGLSKANGEWIVFLDADDEMLPNNLEVLTSLIGKNDVIAASANVLVRSLEGTTCKNELRIKKAQIFSNFIKALLRHQALFSTGATIFAKDILGEKPYNEKLCRYEDAEFELKIFVKGSIVMSPTPIIIHHLEFAELSHLRTNDFEKDFIFSMDFAHKTFWQKVKMGQFINEGCFAYKDGASLLRDRYGRNYYWKYAYKIISKFYGTLYRLTK